MERRRLVGRRFGDFIRNKIKIELSPEEHLIRMLFSDLRYNPLVERRRHVRREAEHPDNIFFVLFQQETSFSYFEILNRRLRDSRKARRG